MSNTADELDDRIQRLLDQGDELLNQDRPEEAIALYVTAWKLLPEPRTDQPSALHVTDGHARRLRDMAWLPLFDGFLLDSHYSVAWSYPAVEGTPWRNGFFLEPIVRPHREFRFAVEGDEAFLLWHIPISDEERAFKNEHGSNALLDRMEAVSLPWVFDENNRPPLLG